MKVRKRLIGVGVILALIAGLFLPTSLAQASEVTVRLDAPAQVTTGNGFVARLNISHVEGFDAAVLRVRFDPAILSLTSVTGGNIGGTTIPVVATVEKEPGLIGITANVPGFPGVTGEGYLMEFHFLALDSGGVDIGLEHHSLSNKDAQLIPATWVGVDDLAVDTDDGVLSSPSPPTISAEVAEITSPELAPELLEPLEETTEPAVPPSAPLPSPKPFNWLLVGGAIAGGLIVVGVVIYLVRRRAC